MIQVKAFDGPLDGKRVSIDPTQKVYTLKTIEGQDYVYQVMAISLDPRGVVLVPYKMTFSEAMKKYTARELWEQRTLV